MREPRTIEDMGNEARWLPGFLEAIERRYVNSAVHRSVILASDIQGNTISLLFPKTDVVLVDGITTPTTHLSGQIGFH